MSEAMIGFYGESFIATSYDNEDIINIFRDIPRLENRHINFENLGTRKPFATLPKTEENIVALLLSSKDHMDRVIEALLELDWNKKMAAINYL